MAVDVGSAVGYLDLDISGFLKGLRSAQSEADTTSKNIATKIGNNFQSIGKSFSSAGTTLTKSVTVPIVGLGTAVVKVKSDFESAMSKVSAISGATGGDLDALNKKAQEMGAKTKFSATESAEAFTYMAMAGWKTKDMLNGIDGIMSLAAADGLDLATTSDIVTDALTAFGLSASDSGHFADVLAKAASNANTNVSMLGESFKYAAPVAGALGYSAEDTAIALGLMANAGIKSSQGGTALRGSLTRLIKPTDEAAALMERYGLSMTNSDGSMKSLGEVMDMLRDKLGGLTEAEQAQVAAQIFGQEAMSGMLAIINASDSDYAKLTDAIYDADGAAQQMADTMLDNLSGQLTLLKSALEGLAIQFGEILVPYIKQFIERIQSLTQKLQELTLEQKEQIVKWAAFAAAIGPVLLVFGKLTSSFGSIITMIDKVPAAITKTKASFTALSTGFKNISEGFNLAKAGYAGLATSAGGAGTKIGVAMAGISTSCLAVVAIIGILIAAFAHLWKTNEDFKNKMMAIWDGIKSKFESFAQGIVDRLNALGFDFENFSELLKGIWEGFCNFLAPIFEGVFQQVSNVFTFVTNTILSVLDIFVGIFTGDWDQVWEGVKGIFESVWTFISDTFNNVINTILGIFGITREEFSTKWTELWQNVKDWFEQKWNEMLTFFSELPYKIGYWLGEMLGKAITWAKEFPEKAKTAATDFFNRLKEWFIELPGKLKSWLDNTTAKAKQFATDFPKKAKEAGEDFRDTLRTKLEELPGKMLSIGRNIVEGIWNGIKNAKQWLIDKLKSFASGITDGLKDALGIHSPSTVMEKEVGKFMPPGIANGFIKSMPVAISKMQSALNKNLNKLGAKNVETDATADLMVDSLKSKYEELALWFESVEQRINKSIQGMIYSLLSVSNGSLLDTNLGYIGYNGFKREPNSIGGFENKSEPTQSNGNTFIFNSPEPINPIEAARLVRKTEKDIIEGF